DLAGLAVVLNDSQCWDLEDYWAWYMEGCRIEAPADAFAHRVGFYDNRQHLRFWAGLRPPQQQAVLAGGILAVAQMSPIQRQAFVVAFTSRPERSGIVLPPGRPAGAAPDHPPTAAEFAAGGFSLTRREIHQRL